MLLLLELDGEGSFLLLREKRRLELGGICHEGVKAVDAVLPEWRRGRVVGGGAFGCLLGNAYGCTW